jgi:hypothetical protein
MAQNFPEDERQQLPHFLLYLEDNYTDSGKQVLVLLCRPVAEHRGDKLLIASKKGCSSLTPWNLCELSQDVLKSSKQQRMHKNLGMSN